MLDAFDELMAVAREELDLVLRDPYLVQWAESLLNPRRLRGSDFLMRWSQGQWSEERVMEAVRNTNEYFALPYGPSGVAPADDIRAVELYLERLEKAGLGRVKRPDLLVYPRGVEGAIRAHVASLGGAQELPFRQEDEPDMRHLLAPAVLAVECENSLWRARQMPDFGRDLRPMRRLGGRLGLPKGAVLPTVILKEEDRGPLADWQAQTGVPVHIWHVFYDLAYGLSLAQAERLIREGLVEAETQVFQAPGGATTRKAIYKVYYQHAYALAEAQEEPTLVADYVVDKNGHILPYVKFSGGTLTLTQEALNVLHEARDRRHV